MKLSPLPVLHCLPSSFSLSPVGHTQEYPVGFGRHKWLQPPLFSWHLSIFSRPSIKIHFPNLIRRILLTDTGEQFKFATFVPSKPRHIFLKQSFSTWYCKDYLELWIFANSQTQPILPRLKFAQTKLIFVEVYWKERFVSSICSKRGKQIPQNKGKHFPVNCNCQSQEFYFLPQKKTHHWWKWQITTPSMKRNVSLLSTPVVLELWM